MYWKKLSLFPYLFVRMYFYIRLRARIKDDEFLHFDFFVGPIDLDIEKLRCNVPSSEPIVKDFIEGKIFHRSRSVY